MKYKIAFPLFPSHRCGSHRPSFSGFGKDVHVHEHVNVHVNVYFNVHEDVIVDVLVLVDVAVDGFGLR